MSKKYLNVLKELCTYPNMDLEFTLFISCEIYSFMDL